MYTDTEQPLNGLELSSLVRFIGNDSACLVLGDNIFYGSGTGLYRALKCGEEQKATVFGYWVFILNDTVGRA